MTIKRLASVINQYCSEYKAFFAVGLIKETLSLWRIDANYDMLHDDAKIYVDHYLRG